MEHHDKHIADIQKLEDEIRKLAIPYISEEPGSLYWANFRVRVMARVAQKEEKAGLLSQIQQWIAGHIWGSSIAISTAALLVAGVLLFRPFDGNAPLKQGASPVPMAVAQPTVPAQAVQQPVVSHKSQATDRTHGSYAAISRPVDEQVDLATVAESAEPAEVAVSLDELSTTQLQAIAQDLEENE